MKITDFIDFKQIDSSKILEKVKELDESFWEKAETVNSTNNVRETDQLTITNNPVFEFFNKTAYEIIQPLVYEYCVKHKVPISEDEGFRILRYGVGQHYKIHVDSNKSIHRDISLVWVLNNDFEGGDLVFSDLGIKLDLLKHNFVLFPSYFLFKHEVLPVTKGTKYSLVTWLK